MQWHLLLLSQNLLSAHVLSIDTETEFHKAIFYLSYLHLSLLLLWYLCRRFSAIWLTIGAYVYEFCFLRPVCTQADVGQLGRNSSKSDCRWLLLNTIKMYAVESEVMYSLSLMLLEGLNQEDAVCDQMDWCGRNLLDLYLRVVTFKSRVGPRLLA